MLNAFLLLVAFQLGGELVAEAAGLPVPGMVIGLLLLFGLLELRGHRGGAAHAIPADLDTLARGLHGILGLLFVPAGVGVLAQRDLLAVEGGAILVAVLLSTLLAAALTASIAAHRRAARHAPTSPALQAAPEARP